MLSLHVHFLTGRYSATAYNDRSRAEWPPHPARLYSALVDALYSEGATDPLEVRALDWLAGLPAPVVVAPKAHHRRTMTSFVPVNDAAVTDSASLAKREGAVREADHALGALPDDASEKSRVRAGKIAEKARADLVAAAVRAAQAGDPGKLPKSNPGPGVLPWGRTKQPRTFPAVIPFQDRASIVWPEADLTASELNALQRVAHRVVRLGHSSSFVHVWADPSPVDLDEHAWTPDDRGDLVLRVPMEGQRAALDHAYAMHGGDLSGRVMPARHVRYATVRAPHDEGHTDRTRGRWIAYQLTGAALPPASAAVAVAEAVRDTALSFLTGVVPASLSGLQDGSPTTAPHLAVLPLPFVGHPHADGAIRGFALCLPGDLDPAIDHQLLHALGRWELAGDAQARRVEFLVRGRSVEAVRVVDPAVALKTLQRDRWAGPSRRWATVTPIALDGECGPLNHPEDSVRRKAHQTAAKLIRKAVVRAVRPPDGQELLAQDVALTLVFDTAIIAGPHLRTVPRYQRPGHARPRRLVHAVLELPFPVRGPLVLGSGRHLGLGLCAPSGVGSGRGR